MAHYEFTLCHKFFAKSKISCIRWKEDKSSGNEIRTRFAFGESGNDINYLKMFEIVRSEAGQDFEWLEIDRIKFDHGITSMEFCDPHTLVVGDNGGSVSLLQYQNKKFYEKFKWTGVHRVKGPVSCYDVASFDHLVASSGGDGSTHLFDAINCEKIYTHQCMVTVRCLAFNNQNILISGDDCGLIKVLDTRTPSHRESITLINESYNRVSALAQNPYDEFNLISAYGDGSLRVWDTRQFKSHIFDRNLHSDEVTRIMFHPTRLNLLITSSADSGIYSLDPGSALPSNKASTVESKTNQPKSRWSNIPAYDHQIETHRLIDEEFLTINDIDILNDHILAGTDSEYIVLIERIK